MNTKYASHLTGRRLRLVLASLVVAAACVLLAACGSSGETRSGVRATPGAEAPGYHGMILADPLVKPDFTLTDVSGSEFDFRKETEGYLTLLYFGYTYCPDICPSHLANIAAAMSGLPEDVSNRVKVVFVSVDPERDTPDRLRVWLSLFNPSFVGLRGTVDVIDKIQKETLGPLSFSIMKHDSGNGGYTVSHSALVFAYTPDNLAHIAYPSGVYKQDWANDIALLVKKGWQEP